MTAKKNLKRFFDPRNVAVVGASATKGRPGRVVIENDTLHAERGSGQYLRRGAPDLTRRAPVAPAQRPHGRVLKALIGLGEEKA